MSFIRLQLHHHHFM